MKLRFATGTLALLGLSAMVVGARADEEKIPLDKVPAAVMKAVKAKFPKAEIKEAEKEVEKGETTYEIELKEDGHEFEVSLKEDGTILEVEKQIPVKDLPKAVADAVMAKYPKGTIKKVEEVTKGEKTEKTYEVVVSDGGKAREVLLDPTGKILKDEADDEN